MPLPKFEGDEFEFPDEKEEKAKAKAKFNDDEDKDGAELKIEIEDDTPPEDRGRKPAPPPEELTDEELKSYDDKVQARFKKFTRGYHDERRAKETALREKEAAEEFARKVYEENKKLQEQLSSGSKQFIETSKTAASGALEMAKKKYKEAYESGDPDAIVEAQSEITQATLKLQQAEQMKPIEHKEKDEEFSAAKPDEAASKVSPRTKRWIDSNKEWFGKDEEMTMAAMGIDKKLQREYGPEYVGTEEYFQTVDRTMRKRFPEFFESQSEEEDDPPPPKRSAPVEEDDEPPRRASKPATVVAPATRSSSPSRIKLKQSQVALARKLGITPEQYAKQVALLNRGE
jgi:hypothetical protein